MTPGCTYKNRLTEEEFAQQLIYMNHIFQQSWQIFPYEYLFLSAVNKIRVIARDA